MILVDTSVWEDFVRHGDPLLAQLLAEDRVYMHPYVIGELALGSLRQREIVLSDLHKIPNAKVADHAEVLRMIEERSLHGRGIGYVDVHLLASARLTPGTQLWSRDRRLNAAAEALGVAARLAH